MSGHETRCSGRSRGDPSLRPAPRTGISTAYISTLPIFHAGNHSVRGLYRNVARKRWRPPSGMRGAAISGLQGELPPAVPVMAAVETVSAIAMIVLPAAAITAVGIKVAMILRRQDGGQRQE